MAEYELEYGRTSLAMSVGPERVVGELAPRPVAGVADVTSAVRTAIAQPIASPPLRDLLAGKRSALILTVDHTRPSPAPLIEPILDLCEELRVEPVICVATGRHRLMNEQEIETHFPPPMRERAPVIQHDAFNGSRVRELGTTSRGTPVLINRIAFEHEVVIGAGILEPSYLCGFSGGRKLLVPGIAHHTTVDANHFLLTQPSAVIGQLEGNPVSEDAVEAARKVPFHFIVYAVSGPNDEVAEVIAGDPYIAHREGCRRTAALYHVDPVTAYVVISSPGGYPYDCDLVQTKKAVVPATQLVNKGGVIILVGECVEGLGAEETFLEWLRTKTPAEVVRDVRKRECFSLGAHGAKILAKPIVERNAKVLLVTRPEICEELADTYVTAVPSLEEAWELAEASTSPEASVAIVRKARRLIVS